MKGDAIDRVFVRPLQVLQKSARRQRPATAFLAFERAFQQGSLQSSHVFDAIRTALEQARADPHLELQLRPTSRIKREVAHLFDQLDAIHPGAVAQLIQGSGTFCKQRVIAAIRTEQLDKRAAQARGEARSELLQELARHGLEQVYGHFLRLVLYAHRATRGESFSSNLSFGAVVARVSQLGIVPAVVFPTAGKMRNAAAHGHWLYDPSRGTVALRDASGWNAHMRLAEVHRFIRKAVSAASLLNWAVRRSIRPMMIEFSAILSADASGASEHHAESLLRKMEASHAYLKSLGWIDG